MNYKIFKKRKGLEEILHQSMEYSLMAGGKRLRPILVLATYKLIKMKIMKNVCLML